jgi:hypothetical protein
MKMKDYNLNLAKKEELAEIIEVFNILIASVLNEECESFVSELKEDAKKHEGGFTSRRAERARKLVDSPKAVARTQLTTGYNLMRDTNPDFLSTLCILMSDGRVFPIHGDIQQYKDPYVERAYLTIEILAQKLPYIKAGKIPSLLPQCEEAAKKISAWKLTTDMPWYN